MKLRDIAQFFVEIELQLIASLKRNLQRHRNWEKAEGFEWPAWQAEKLKHIDRFRRQNKAILNEYTPVIDAETKALMQEQFIEGQKQVDKEIAELGVAPQPTVDHFFGVNAPRIETLIEDIQKSERTAETSTLRLMDDVYRQTVLKAETALSAGAVTLPQAVDMATKDFLAKGINSIEYKNGRRVNIATYIEMALRTAGTRSYLRGEAKRRGEYGIDTVLVSQYGACSETCLPWQGRVYIDDVWGDFSGETSSTMGKSINGKWYPLLSVAIKAGLFHPNCRHTLSTWYEGVSQLPKPLDAEKVKRTAKLEAQQRSLECEVRKWKRFAEGTQDPITSEAYRNKVKDAQKNLRNFIREHSDVLRRDPWREKTLDVPLEKAQKDGILRATIKKEAQIRGVLHLVPEPIDVESLTFDANHIDTERKHGISEQQAKGFIRKAKVSVTVWKGEFERYYSEDGAVYVNRYKNEIRTAFGTAEFKDDIKLILEVLKRYGI